MNDLIALLGMAAWVVVGFVVHYWSIERSVRRDPHSATQTHGGLQGAIGGAFIWPIMLLIELAETASERRRLRRRATASRRSIS